MAAARLPVDYGRYGAELPARRYERVLARPPDALFCMECVRTYSLRASSTEESPRKLNDG